MALINDRKILSNTYRRLSDDEPTPAEGDILLSLARMRKEAGALSAHKGKVGVWVAPDDAPEDVALLLDVVSVVAIEFPKFTDGRGYSTARLLRERYGYKGELRAVGNVLRDQLFYMARCGFDSFDLAPGKDPEDALKAFEDFSVTYQAAADDPRPLFRRAARPSS